MKCKDLSDFRGPSRHSLRPTKCVGWLDAQMDFPVGKTDEYVVPLLWDLCRHCVVVARGYVSCPLCAPGRIISEYNGEKLILGGAQIRVFGDEIVYASPDLIFHYVLEHNYRPPDEFVTALRNQPLPWSGEYAALVGKAVE